MSAGTMTLTNGSAIVAGAGTSFSTELTAGDFIVTVVGGIPYTLPVKTVGSNFQVELVSNFTGPTQSGAAWYAVPRVALNMVTAAMVAQNTEALRGLNYDKQNWQQLFSGTGIITVRLPDNSTYTGPSWNSFTTVLEGKASKGANADITSLSGLTTALTVAQGGTGGTTASEARDALGVQYGNATGTVAQGNDARLGTVNNKSGGVISGAVEITPPVDPSGNAASITVQQGKNNTGDTMGNALQMSVANGYNPNAGFYVNSIRGYWYSGSWQLGGARGGGANLQSVVLGVKGDSSSPTVSWSFNANGQAVGTWTPASDERIKENISIITEPLVKMRQLRGREWDRTDTNQHGYGFVAQEVEKVFPAAVSTFGDVTLVNGEVVHDARNVDTWSVAAALHHEAILVLMTEVEELKNQVKFLASKEM